MSSDVISFKNPSGGQISIKQYQALAFLVLTLLLANVFLILVQAIAKDTFKLDLNCAKDAILVFGVILIIVVALIYLFTPSADSIFSI